MMKREMKFFDMARAVSKTSTYIRVKIGAVIVSKKQIISVGTNVRKSHPLQKRLNRFRSINVDNMAHSLHAEINAIIRANEDLTNTQIYVYREDQNGNLANCRPCAACMQEIKKVGIKTIYYTTSDGDCREDLSNIDDVHKLISA